MGRSGRLTLRKINSRNIAPPPIGSRYLQGTCSTFWTLPFPCGLAFWMPLRSSILPDVAGVDMDCALPGCPATLLPGRPRLPPSACPPPVFFIRLMRHGQDYVDWLSALSGTCTGEVSACMCLVGVPSRRILAGHKVGRGRIRWSVHG